VLLGEKNQNKYRERLGILLVKCIKYVALCSAEEHSSFLG